MSVFRPTFYLSYTTQIKCGPGLFKGKVALVTGGGSGIGKAITTELLTLGCQVVIASRNMDKLTNAKESLKDIGDVQAVQCNIRKEDDVKSVISQVLKSHGKIDFLVNNGGGQFPSMTADMSLKGWNAVIETNLTGTFLMSKEIAAAVCYLLSPAAAYVTGTTLTVDGGSSLYSPPLVQIDEHDKMPPYEWNPKSKL